MAAPDLFAVDEDGRVASHDCHMEEAERPEHRVLVDAKDSGEIPSGGKSVTGPTFTISDGPSKLPCYLVVQSHRL